jgi:hypothetical protein
MDLAGAAENGGLSQPKSGSKNLSSQIRIQTSGSGFFFFFLPAQVEGGSTNNGGSKRMWILKQRSMEIEANQAGKVLLKRHGENELLGKNVP